jgi:hypothetical protein
LKICQRVLEGEIRLKQEPFRVAVAQGFEDRRLASLENSMVADAMEC